MKRTMQCMLLFLLAALTSYAQEIPFDKISSWAEILKKARQEKKYILVDCYTTWCVPCKKMDQDVFSNPDVNTEVEKQFIPVKVQMDKTPSDDTAVRTRYKDAELLASQYNIRSYPSVLLFSPEGQLVYRVGFQEKDEFLQTLVDTTNPEKNVKGKMTRFEKGEMQRDEMLEFISFLKSLSDNKSALKVAAHYKEKYLNALPVDSLLSKPNLSFITSNIEIINSNDSFFKLLYKDGKRVDSLIGRKMFAQRVVDYVISKDEIDAETRVNGKPIIADPSWNNLEEKIGRKYDPALAKRLILQSKIVWYNEKKDWPKAVKYFVERTEAEGISNQPLFQEGLNTDIYELILTHSNDTTSLQKAIGWMEALLKINPERYQWLDTYASLLYKVGRRAEALKWEEKALQLAQDNKDKSITFYESIIKKMKANEAIW